MLLTALIESATATGSSYRRFPSSQTCFAQATLFDPSSRRLAHVPSAAALRGQAPIAGTGQSCARRTNRYQETPFIVIRKHRSTSRRRRRPYCTISSRAALWGITRNAERLGTAGMGRDTCADQAPHLWLQSSAFWSPGAAAQ